MSTQEQRLLPEPEAITIERVDELRNSLDEQLAYWQKTTHASTYFDLGVDEEHIESLTVAAQHIFDELERVQKIIESAAQKTSDVSMRAIYDRARRDYDDLYMRSMTRFFSQFTHVALLTK